MLTDVLLIMQKLLNVYNNIMTTGKNELSTWVKGSIRDI
jgi:hypothetical protein